MPPEPSQLSDAEVRGWFSRQIPWTDFRGKRVLVLVPDATRTAPLPLLFDSLCSGLSNVAKQVDVLIALGTHPPLDEGQISRLLGLDERARERFPNLHVFHHEWNCDQALCTLGHLSAAETREISQGRLSLD